MKAGTEGKLRKGTCQVSLRGVSVENEKGLTPATGNGEKEGLSDAWLRTVMQHLQMIGGRWKTKADWTLVSSRVGKRWEAQGGFHRSPWDNE